VPLFLAVLSSLLASFPALAEPPLGPDISQYVRSPHDKLKVGTYAVQIGAYTNLRKAAIIRDVVANLGPARVDKLTGDYGAILYRVLVGSFNSIEAAEQFAHDSRLKKLFPELWMNPVSLPSPNGKSEEVSKEDLKKDPHYLDMTLNCEAGKKWGQHRMVLLPEDKTVDNEMALTVHWNCIPNTPENWLARDTERNPSHWSIAPLAGFGGLSTTDPTGERNAFNFSYGLQLAAFKSFGGMGPVAEYRVLNHRYTGATGMTKPMFVFENRLLVGARLPYKHWFEIEPLFGFMNHQFMQTPTPTTIRIESALVPQAALKFRYRLVEMTERAFIDFAGAYHHLFATETDTLDVRVGSLITFALRARHFFPQGWGADWFAEYSLTSQKANTVEQTESRFLIGLTLMGPF
jgi:hypothetical protein